MELVEQQLNVSGQESDEGLLQLQADLSELIGLTQGVCVRVRVRVCVCVCVCVLHVMPVQYMIFLLTCCIQTTWQKSRRENCCWLLRDQISLNHKMTLIPRRIVKILQYVYAYNRSMPNMD